jgi:outer membrane protein assembly factor BamB
MNHLNRGQQSSRIPGWWVIASLLVTVVAVFSFFGYFLSRRDAAAMRPAMEGPSLETSPLATESPTNDAQYVSEPNAASDHSSNEITTAAEPWSRFRGPNGTGHSTELNIPTRWSDTENVRWTAELPGAGSSSPILTEKFVFVTSYSGYGGPSGGGSLKQLQRHLSCIDRTDGKILWTKSIEASQPDDPYQGMGVPEHGYATNTPVTDGTTVYAFFGKSGVIAFDFIGKELWRTNVGTDSGNRGWGTAASLILYNDMLIVNAAEESRSIRALDKKTGQERWKAAADGLELAYGTPIIAKVNAQRTDIVIAVPGEVWGLDPNNGKLIWFVTTALTGNLSPSVILDGDLISVFGGYRSSGSMAIRIGGKGDVTKSHVVWTGRNSSYVSTPVLVEEKLYWIDDRGTYYCISAKSGELLNRSRVTQIQSRDRPVYASPIVAGGHIYFQSRHDGLIVASLNPKLDVVQHNRFESDATMFNATPAVSRGELFLRSDTKLYCISN